QNDRGRRDNQESRRPNQPDFWFQPIEKSVWVEQIGPPVKETLASNFGGRRRRGCMFEVIGVRLGQCGQAPQQALPARQVHKASAFVVVERLVQRLFERLANSRGVALAVKLPE